MWLYETFKLILNALCCHYVMVHPLLGGQQWHLQALLLCCLATMMHLQLQVVHPVSMRASAQQKC